MSPRVSQIGWIQQCSKRFRTRLPVRICRKRWPALSIQHVASHTKGRPPLARPFDAVTPTGDPIFWNPLSEDEIELRSNLKATRKRRYTLLAITLAWICAAIGVAAFLPRPAPTAVTLALLAGLLCLLAFWLIESIRLLREVQ